MGGQGSGRYPKGSGGEKDVSKAGIGKHGGDDTTGIQREDIVLTNEEMSVLNDYKVSGYIKINKLLRQTGEYPEEIKKEIETKIKKIDSAMQKASTSSEVTAYRVVSNSHTKNLNEGDIFEDKGFVSTSVDKRILKAAFDESMSSITIFVPKGTKALPLKGSSFSHSEESELLLNRGTKFKVLKKSGNDIEVEVVK
jgi:hypothetical protein